MANGFNLETDFSNELPDWLESINNGVDIDKFKTQIRTNARRLLPEAIRNQIPPDEDLYDSPPDRNRRRRPAESRD